MKKVIYTIQMVALMASFPVYLVTELNHSKVAFPIDNSSLKNTSPNDNKNQLVKDDSKTEVSLLQHTANNNK